MNLLGKQDVFRKYKYPHSILSHYHKPSINFQSLAVMVGMVEDSSTVVTCHEILQIDPFTLLSKQ